MNTITSIALKKEKEEYDPNEEVQEPEENIVENEITAVCKEYVEDEPFKENTEEYKSSEEESSDEEDIQEKLKELEEEKQEELERQEKERQQEEEDLKQAEKREKEKRKTEKAIEQQHRKEEKKAALNQQLVRHKLYEKDMDIITKFEADYAIRQQKLKIVQNMSEMCIRIVPTGIRYFSPFNPTAFELVTSGSDRRYTFKRDEIIKINLKDIESIFSHYEKLIIESKREQSLYEENTSKGKFNGVWYFPDKGILFPVGNIYYSTHMKTIENISFGNVQILEFNHILISPDLTFQISKVNIIRLTMSGVLIYGECKLNISSSLKHLYLDCVPITNSEKIFLKLIVPANIDADEFSLFSTWYIDKSYFSSIFKTYVIQFTPLMKKSEFKKAKVKTFTIDICYNDFNNYYDHDFFSTLEHVNIDTLIVHSHPIILSDNNVLFSTNIQQNSILESFKTDFSLVNLNQNIHLRNEIKRSNHPALKELEFLLPFSSCNIKNLYLDECSSKFLYLNPAQLEKIASLEFIYVECSYGYPSVFPEFEGIEKKVKYNNLDWFPFYAEKTNDRLLNKYIFYEEHESTLCLINNSSIYTVPLQSPFVRENAQCFLRYSKLKYGLYATAAFNLHFNQNRKAFEKKVKTKFSPGWGRLWLEVPEDDEDEIYKIANVKPPKKK